MNYPITCAIVRITCFRRRNKCVRSVFSEMELPNSVVLSRMYDIRYERTVLELICENERDHTVNSLISLLKTSSLHGTLSFYTFCASSFDELKRICANLQWYNYPIYEHSF